MLMVSVPNTDGNKPDSGKRFFFFLFFFSGCKRCITAALTPDEISAHKN